MGMLKEFRDFAVRGNVVDMAVGIIIGGAFGKIVTSLVNDVLMPPIGRILGNVDFSDLFISLNPAKTQGLRSLAEAKQAGAAVIAYGAFINTILDFAIVAFCLFVVIKAMNEVRKRLEPPAVTTKDCPFCLSKVPLRATKCAFCTAELERAG